MCNVISKNQLKRINWFKVNGNKESIQVFVNDLYNYEIPISIIEKMKEWDLIYKSPYSNSFYNSAEVTFSHKPHGTLRVSNHWNFKSTRDNKKHSCTKQLIEEDFWGIGVFDAESKTYEIIHKEKSPKKILDEQLHADKFKYITNIELIDKKRKFCKLVDDNKIFVKINYAYANENICIDGLLKKYTGNKIIVLDKITKVVILSDERINRKNPVILLYDAEDVIYENLFEFNLNKIQQYS
jgi:hypothetical protein